MEPLTQQKELSKAATMAIDSLLDLWRDRLMDSQMGIGNVMETRTETKKDQPKESKLVLYLDQPKVQQNRTVQMKEQRKELQMEAYYPSGRMRERRTALQMGT